MKFFVATLLCMGSFSSFAANPVLTYEPATVDLSGTLDLQTFPGPPSYESTKDGDDIERHFYLKLDAAVDVSPKGDHPGVSNPEEERNVRVMQLSIAEGNDALWARFRETGKGARVQIRGSLFHRFTGHHHSRVLLGVQDMKPLKP
jgi:hypothetical protein